MQNAFKEPFCQATKKLNFKPTPQKISIQTTGDIHFMQIKHLDVGAIKIAF